MQRVNESLIERGYVTWFDLTNMKGGHAARSLSLSLFLLLGLLHSRFTLLDIDTSHIG
jgi:hypothetical protein